MRGQMRAAQRAVRAEAEPVSRFLCVPGEVCELNITGVNLSATDKVGAK